MFEAQKRTTKYCSHKCNSKHYKIRKRLEVKKEVEGEVNQQIKPKVNALSMALIKGKEFLTVNEVAHLLNCSKMTVYRMIKEKSINSYNLSKRLTRIKRSDIEILFEKKTTIPVKELTIDDCYIMEQIINKFNVSRNTIYNYVSKHGIKRIKQDGVTYYSIQDIERIFNV
jgi:excisionase family DNA binding protein